MPALPAAAGVIRTTIGYTLPSDTTALSRLFFHYSGTPPTATQLSTFAANVGTLFSTSFAGVMAVGVSNSSVNCEDLTSATGAIGSDFTSHAGTRTGGELPGSTCVMVQFLIARRYRGGKPKIFYPFGVATDIASNGQWSPGLLSAVGSNQTGFINGVLAAGWTGAGTLSHVNVSYYQGFTVVTNPITHRSRNVPTLRGAPVIDTVTSYSVEQGIATQRRRNQV